MGKFVEEEEQVIVNKPKQIIQQEKKKNKSKIPLTPQTLFARIAKCLKQDLEKFKDGKEDTFLNFLTEESRKRIVRLIIDQDKNYKFARTNILTILEYMILTKMIK